MDEWPVWIDKSKQLSGLDVGIVQSLPAGSTIPHPSQIHLVGKYVTRLSGDIVQICQADTLVECAM